MTLLNILWVKRIMKHTNTQISKICFVRYITIYRHVSVFSVTIIEGLYKNTNIIKVSAQNM